MLRHPFATNFGVFAIYRSKAIQSFWNHGKIFRNKKVREQNVDECGSEYLKLNGDTRNFLMGPLISSFTMGISMNPVELSEFLIFLVCCFFGTAAVQSKMRME